MFSLWKLVIKTCGQMLGLQDSDSELAESTKREVNCRLKKYSQKILWNGGRTQHLRQA